MKAMLPRFNPLRRLCLAALSRDMGPGIYLMLSLSTRALPFACCIIALLAADVLAAAEQSLLYVARAPAGKDAKLGGKSVVSHGISLTADETEVWVVDQVNSGVHVFDVSGLPESPPAWLQYIDTHDGSEQDADGNYMYGESGIVNQPGWIMSSIDGEYLYPESGEIIDVAAKQVIGNLVGANGAYVHSRFALEVEMRDGRVTRVGDQQGVGRRR